MVGNVQGDVANLVFSEVLDHIEDAVVAMVIGKVNDVGNAVEVVVFRRRSVILVVLVIEEKNVRQIFPAIFEVMSEVEWLMRGDFHEVVDVSSILVPREKKTFRSIDDRVEVSHGSAKTNAFNLHVQQVAKGSCQS